MLKPVAQEILWEGVIEQGSNWAYAEEGSYKMNLKMVHERWDEYKQQAVELEGLLKAKFTDEILFENFCNAVYGEKIDTQSWLDELESTFVE